MSSYIRDGTIIAGWPAYSIERILRRHWREEVLDLPPNLRRPLEEALEALQQAGAAWADEVRAERLARGNAEAVAEETESCLVGQLLSSKEVAVMLQVTERRVRQLAASGVLPGRQDSAGRWTFEEAAVLAARQERGA